MQEFRAQEEDFEKYDLIWIQWVIIYASDGKLNIYQQYVYNLCLCFLTTYVHRITRFIFTRMLQIIEERWKDLYQR